MKELSIVVCLKQVPETTEVKIDPATHTLIREGVESIVNPFDLYAIEEAVRIKERNGSGKITALTMGPPQAENVLKEAIASGCDEAVLVSDKAFAGSDTWATSYTLAKAIEKIQTYDLILCGRQAIDGDTAQVGPGIACHLDIPQIMYVKKIEELNDTLIQVERMTEEGYEVIESPLPALISVVKEINEPRIPNLRGKLRAKKTDVICWKADDLSLDKSKIGLDGSPTQVIKIFTPPPREGGQILNGNLSDAVDTIYTFLKNEIL
jgi:electron transfer flavoprotein beta subunit